jgi:hypothetical protein
LKGDMSRRGHHRLDQSPWSFGVVANVAIVALLVLFWGLQAGSSMGHYAAVQEDGVLEWATFWGFLVASGAFIESARRQRQAAEAIPWFVLGVGLFCFLVGMEEVSWGQRIFGYRSPSYFLANNLQQEFNLHNVIDADLRARAVQATILVYGILLPLAGLFAPLRRVMRQLGVIAPPMVLVPAFAVMLFFYLWYPWRYLDEVVESMLALGFMFAGLWMMDSLRSRDDSRYSSVASLGVTLCAIGFLSFASAAFSQSSRGVHPGDLRAAIAETKMLKQDFLTIEDETGNVPSECGVHDRIYSFAGDYDVELLDRGAFASLVQQGLPEQRADFFIDPWDTAYWVRDRCSEDTDERVVFVYSMGPNRRRDSNEWRIRGDDIGAYVLGGPEEHASRDE